MKRTENYSCIVIFALFLENIGPNCFNVPLFLHLRLRDICKRSCPWFARDSASKFSQISLSWMKHDSAPKIVAWKHKCWVTSRRIPTGSARYIASNKYAWTRQDCSPLKTARDKIINCFCKEWYRLNIHRPFPHYAPVSKDKEVRTRLGWTISYKSPHLSTWASSWCLCLQEYRKGLWDRQALKRQETRI